MRVRLGPHPELFHIVAVGEHGARRAFRGLAEDRQGVLDLAEGNGVPEAFQDREDREELALILGEEVPVQVRGLQARGQEVRVVQQRVPRARAGQERRKRRLPHAFGQPHAEGVDAEVLLRELPLEGDVRQRVAPRDRREDGLVERAAHDLDLPAGDHVGQEFDVLRPVLEQPLQQAAAQVVREADGGVAGGEFQERPVAARVRLFHDPGEIAHRLMAVKGQVEANVRFGHDGLLGSQVRCYGIESPGSSSERYSAR
ncbi:MAG TPA: hypothetical protein PLZ80_05965 [Planctomycetota bacterium]|nr:hypothetical protein [Planctomycetota bacterium]